ncbi:MAG: MarC family protein [Verrucomicrobiae bacterium]|nr:MarC family protein [Verrucomicrobiae bacterium]
MHSVNYWGVGVAMTLLEYSLLALSSLFVIVDPIAAVPAFLAMTARSTPEERVRMARLACAVAAGVLLTFALAGRWIFRMLGITLPAFQIAGGFLLFLVALDMLHARRSKVQETAEETAAGEAKDDIAITPLAVPMLAGPGAISTALILQGQATDFSQGVALCASIVAVCAASYVILRLSARGAAWLSPLAMTITVRLMGLLLAAVAVQFMINAAQTLGILTGSGG